MRLSLLEWLLYVFLISNKELLVFKKQKKIYQFELSQAKPSQAKEKTPDLTNLPGFCSDKYFFSVGHAHHLRVYMATGVDS